jgi:LytS/YehU family sensor histidine kinase
MPVSKALMELGYSPKLAAKGMHVVQRSNALYRERVRAQAALDQELTTARLRALEMQLQPHFLFNTLHAVGGLIRQGESEAAIETLTRLSDLLRVTLAGEGRPLVPLGEELAHTDLYLEIQRIRFADRLSIEREVEPGTEAIPVPAFILQPLVENAIRHGIARKAGAGRLRLTARLLVWCRWCL